MRSSCPVAAVGRRDFGPAAHQPYEYNFLSCIFPDWQPILTRARNGLPGVNILSQGPFAHLSAGVLSRGLSAHPRWAPDGHELVRSDVDLLSAISRPAPGPRSGCAWSASGRPWAARRTCAGSARQALPGRCWRVACSEQRAATGRPRARRACICLI